MKISDLIRLISDNEDIVIRESYKSWKCDAGMDSDCKNIDDDKGCEECPYWTYERDHSDMFTGRANEVPIKLADKKISAVYAFDYQWGRSKRTIRHTICIEFKGEDYEKIEV